MREFFERGTLAHRLRAAAWPDGGELLTLVSWMLAALDEIESLGLTHGIRPRRTSSSRPTDSPPRRHPLRPRRFRGRSVTRKPGSEVRTDRGSSSAGSCRSSAAATRRIPSSSPSRALSRGRHRGDEDPAAPPPDRGARGRRGTGPFRAGAACCPPGHPPEPVLVAVLAGPVLDEKASYLAAKHLSALSNRPVPDLSRGAPRRHRDGRSPLPRPRVRPHRPARRLRRPRARDERAAG